MNPPKFAGIAEDRDSHGEGAELKGTVSDLYPICRSITGDGVRESLKRLQAVVPLEIHEVKSGTRVFDWEVPMEWNIRDAYIKNSKGERVVDFRESNLHVLNYSTPIHRRVSLAELREHLFSIPERPDWIPYRTSYYKPAWGFCVKHRQLQSMTDEQYEVCIDSTLQAGHLSYGEFRIQGASDVEVLISAHSCHPSLCNDNLSGMAIAAHLARLLGGHTLRYSYRFIWIPGTIGSITWLALNEEKLPNIRHGLVLSCLGDPGRFTYKRSRRGSAEIDRAVETVLRHATPGAGIEDFTPFGYDERQYCSPGINLPVGCLMRTPNGRYPEYHTSADDLNLVTSDALAGSLNCLVEIINVLEKNDHYTNTCPKGEPQLGKRGLYRAMGGTNNNELEKALLWVLNFSDGKHSLLDIAERSGLRFRQVAEACKVLVDNDLLRF
jgi:aminopeptidase-like protein